MNNNACEMCDNAFCNEKLNVNNDYSATSVGKACNGYRVMLCSGNGNEVRLEFEKYSDDLGWYTLGLYYPKFCPNCGREVFNRRV